MLVQLLVPFLLSFDALNLRPFESPKEIFSNEVRASCLIRLLGVVITKVESLEVDQIDNFFFHISLFLSLVPIIFVFFVAAPLLFLVLIVHLDVHFGRAVGSFTRLIDGTLFGPAQLISSAAADAMIVR